MLTKLTVYIPVLNGAKFISEAIGSILSQSFSDFELIIVNDGSTDKTSDIVHSFSDPRIRLIELPENKGNSFAANVALREAKGKYAVRMDADDISLPDRLSTQYDFMENNPDIILSGGSLKLLVNGKITDQVWEYNLFDHDIRADFLVRSGVMQPASIVRLDKIKEHGVFYNENNQFSYSEDLDFFYRLSKHGKFGNVEQCLIYYRRHAGNITEKLKSRAAELKTPNYLNILKDLGIENKDVDIDAHLMLAGFLPYDLTKEALERYFNWINKLLRTNIQTLFFDQKAMVGIIHKQTDRLFYRLCEQDLVYAQKLIDMSPFDHKTQRRFLFKAKLKKRFKFW
jgi:glycosyltransferase involved in cell wall biosynthesis